MSKRRIAVSGSAIVLAAASVLTFAQFPGHADPAPQAGDVVGVGSDIIQSSVDFLADGSPSGDLGYNSAGNKWRLFDYDSVADGNGRNAFTDPSLGAGVALNPTIQLGAGLSPVQRPNGGGAGLTALENDAADLIDFVRSPNLPTSTDQSKAHNQIGSYLHTIQFADDTQYIATSSDSNLTSPLSFGDLAAIYSGQATTWDALITYEGAHSLPVITVKEGHGGDTIYAERPQDGAGVLTVFVNAINAATGVLFPSKSGAPSNTGWGPKVHPVQQNDPTTITGLSGTGEAISANAIVPFPKGRFDLLDSGYFLNPSTAYSSYNTDPAKNGKIQAAPLTTAGITLQIPSSSTSAAGSPYTADIPYYIVFRETDIAKTQSWQPGSTLNWVRTLFWNPPADDADAGDDGNDSTKPEPFFASTAGQQLLTNLHLQPHYQDLGNAGLS